MTHHHARHLDDASRSNEHAEVTDAATFTRMDQSTAAQWAVIGRETIKAQPRVAERVLGLLRSLAERFADEWDQIAFDPAYDTLPLEHFEPKVRAIFGAMGQIGAKAG